MNRHRLINHEEAERLRRAGITPREAFKRGLLFPAGGGEPGTAELTNEQLGERIEGIERQAQDILSRVTAASTDEDVKAVRAELTEAQQALVTLSEERDKRLRREELDGMKAVIKDIDTAVAEMKESARVPQSDFRFEGGVPVESKSIYAKGERSFFGDVMLARSGDRKAVERLEEAYDGKAMTEGTDSQGGFLVRPQIMPGLLGVKERLPSITNIIPTVRVTTDSIEFVSVTSGLQAGWVAELAAKPSGDLTFGTLLASVFTAAGLAVASNQLLEDSSIDQIIARDLLKRYNNVVAKGIIYGTGTGQPLGILNTSGVNAVTYTDATPTVAELLPQILAAITAVQENNLSEPTHIVMRPSTWTKIISDPGTSPGTYTLGTDSISRVRTAQDPLPARSLFGYPVLLEGNIPNNLGAGTNETRVIVGDFSEALLLDRAGFSVDKSEHVYFTSNQTVFRGEGRVGFTAARYPKAFSVVGGTGLIGF